MSKPKRRLGFDIPFDDYDKMRDILFESDCKNMTELFKRAVLAYEDNKNIKKENKMLHSLNEELQTENKDLTVENKFLMKLLRLDQQNLSYLEKNLGLERENKIFRTRLMDIRRICNYVMETNGNISRQHLLDIKRLTLFLDKCYLEEAAYE